MRDIVRDGEKCEICGNAATRFLFASFLCDDETCIEKARERRGGPGGHKKQKTSDSMVLDKD